MAANAKRNFIDKLLMTFYDMDYFSSILSFSTFAFNGCQIGFIYASSSLIFRYFYKISWGGNFKYFYLYRILTYFCKFWN